MKENLNEYFFYSGIDVLRKKSELQREFSKRKEKEKEKEVERKNSFETRLQEMADKMRKVSKYIPWCYAVTSFLCAFVA